MSEQQQQPPSDKSKGKPAKAPLRPKLKAKQGEMDVLEIIPNDEFVAVFFDLSTGKPFVRPIVCFALVEYTETGKRAVEGLKGGRTVSSCERHQNFLKYVPGADDLADYAEEARAAWLEMKRREEKQGGGK